MQLKNLQHSHARLKERADARLRVAQDRHVLELDHAEKVEAAGWQQFMAISGITISSAAAILEVSESTVSRWVARIAKSPGAAAEHRAPHAGLA